MFNLLTNSISGSGIDPAPQYSTFGSIAGVILNFLLGLSFSLSLVGMAYAGIQYVLSTGDKKSTQKAWQNFLWSFIAGMVTFAAFVFKDSIVNLIGVDSPEIKNNVPTF